MGSDPALFAEKLSLYYYERKWLPKRKGTFKRRKYILIDDLCTYVLSAITNLKIINNYSDIYPDEIKFKRENEDPCKASFLTISIEAHGRKFPTGLLDKRDAFPIYINRISYLGSNIPSKLFYASIYMFSGQRRHD